MLAGKHWSEQCVVSHGNTLAVIDTSIMTVIKEIPDLENPDGMTWYVAQ